MNLRRSPFLIAALLFAVAGMLATATPAGAGEKKQSQSKQETQQVGESRPGTPTPVVSEEEQPPGSDLIVTSAWVVDCELFVEVQNIGPGSTLVASAVMLSDGYGQSALNIPVLNAGASDIVSSTLMTPGTTVTITADIFGAVGETDETNNEFVFPYECEAQIGDVDLFLGNTSLSIVDCTVTFTVMNLGDIDITTAVDVELTVGGAVVAVVPLSIPFPEGTFQTLVSGAITTPGTLTITIDPANSIGDVATGNNTSTLEIPNECDPDWVPTQSPDLVIVAWVTDCVAYYEVTNVGDADANSPIVVDLEFPDTSTGTDTMSTTLSAGAVITGSQALPNGPAGTLNATVDQAGVVIEGDETNNAVSLTVDACGVDLAVVSVTFLADCTAQFSINNDGFADSTTSTNVEFLVDGVSVASVSHVPIAAGAGIVAWSQPITSGTTLTIVVDGVASNDYDLANNTFDIAVPAGCGESPELDLAVINAVFNADCTVSFDVVNLGGLDLASITNAEWSVDGTTLASNIVNPLAAGATTSFTTNAINVAGMATIAVDTFNLTGDIDATNNAVSLPVPDDCVEEVAVGNLGFAVFVNWENCTVDVLVGFGTGTMGTIVDPFTVTIGNSTYTVNPPMTNGQVETFSFGPTFTQATYDVAVDVGDQILETDETDNIGSFTIDQDCLPEITLECFDQYVLITQGNDDQRFYKLDATGNIEWDYGTIPGIADVSELAWAGDTLYGLVGTMLVEIDLDAGTAAGVTNSLPAGLTAMGTWGNLLLAADDEDVYWIDPALGTSGLQYSIPTINPGQNQYTRSIAFDHATATVRLSMYVGNTPNVIDEIWRDSADDGTGGTNTVVTAVVNAMADTGAGLVGYSVHGDRWDVAGTGTLLSSPTDAITRVVSASAYTDGCVDDFTPIVTADDPDGGKPTMDTAGESGDEGAADEVAGDEVTGDHGSGDEGADGSGSEGGAGEASPAKPGKVDRPREGSRGDRMTNGR